MDGEFDPDLIQDFDDKTLIRILQESGSSLPKHYVTLIEDELLNRKQFVVAKI